MRAAVVAAVIVVLLLTHTYGHFTALRIKVVRSALPSAATTLNIPVDDARLDRLQPPFALIARIENGGDAAETFAIALDGVPVCVPTVAAHHSARLDCVVTAAPQPGRRHEVTISEPAPNWTLEYLELATHHGSTLGAFEFLVLPAGATGFAHPAWPFAIVIWVVIVSCLVVSSPTRLPRGVVVPQRVIAGLVGLIVCTCLISQWLSPYRVIFSAKTMVAWVILAFAPRLWRISQWVCRPASEPLSTRARAARPAIVALAVLGAYGSLMSTQLDRSYGGNYSGFLQISAERFDGNPLFKGRDEVRRRIVFADNGGYDGQFMYFAAFDPFLRAFHDNPVAYSGVMDAAPYRFGRIGYSLLTRAISLGRWQWYPAVMVWLVLGSIAMVAFLVGFEAQARESTPAWGAVVLAIPGFWQSLQAGLPEPLAAAALAGGVLCVWRRRWLPAGLLFAVSLLVRETGVVAVLSVLGGAFALGYRRQAVAVTTLAVGILLAWRLYVWWVLRSDWGLQGLLYNPHDLALPFAGFVDLWRAIASGTYYPGFPTIARAGLAYPVALTGAFALSAALVWIDRRPLTVAAFAYACLAVSLNFTAIWVHVSNGQRGTYEVFVLLALCCAGWRAYGRPLRAGLLGVWAIAASYVLVFGFDAANIRSALLLPF